MNGIYLHKIHAKLGWKNIKIKIKKKQKKKLKGCIIESMRVVQNNSQGGRKTIQTNRLLERVVVRRKFTSNKVLGDTNERGNAVIYDRIKK